MSKRTLIWDHQAEIILIDHYLKQSRHWIQRALTPGLNEQSKAAYLELAKAEALDARTLSNRIGRHFGKISTLARFENNLERTRAYIDLTANLGHSYA